MKDNALVNQKMIGYRAIEFHHPVLLLALHLLVKSVINGVFVKRYPKLFCRFFNNAYYARVGGVSTAEMNRMEVKFLFSLDFGLQVNVETFYRFCSHLGKEAAEGLQIDRPIQACKIKENWSSKGDAACVPTIAR